MVGIKNKVQKRKYDRGRQRNRRRKCVGSGTPLTLEDVDQIGANNLLATLFLRMIKDLENALDFSFVIWSLGRSLP